LRTRTFRILALILLALTTAIWLGWLIRDTGPYGWLHPRLRFFGAREGRVLAALLAYVALFPAWIAVTVLLRALTPMHPLREDLTIRGSLRDDVRDHLRAQRQRQATMLDLPPHALVRQRFYRQMGWVGIGVGLGASVVTWVVWYVSGDLWLMLVGISLLGVLGGLLSVITGRPILYDTPKVQQIAGYVRRAGLVIIVITLLVAVAITAVQLLR
jgi:hypothetical protein